MKVEEILIAMEDLLEDAWSLPMSGGKRVVSTAELLELITDLRNSLPEEIRSSNEILARRDKIILQGRDEAELTLKAARARADKLISQETVYQEAQQKAQEIIATAQKNARELKNATVEYCETLLSHTAEGLTKSVSAIEETRRSVHKQKA